MQYRTIRVQALTPWILAALAAGCGSDGIAPPQTASDSPQGSLQSTAARKTPAGDSAGSAKKAAAIIPDGAKYTIVCTAYAGNGHIAQATAAKEQLVQKTGRADFYVLHEEGQSTLYFGYYKAIERQDDPIEAKRAQDDRAYILSITDSSGRRLFPKPLLAPMLVPDPEAPAEYDLAKLDHDKAPDDPTRRYWSIAIAAYTVDAAPSGLDAGKSRKQLAVESVLAARKMGYDAYFYNGDNVSTVCIGAWPRNAVAEQESNDAKSSSDSSQSLIVSASPLPAGVADQLEKNGDNVKVFQPKIHINDASMATALKDFPQYSVNGEMQNNRVTNPQTGQTVSKPQPTFLVEIPRLQPSILGNNGQSPQDSGPPTMINPMTPSSTGGQLRSVTK